MIAELLRESAEFRLICRALRQAGVPGAVLEETEEPVNWGKVCEAARRHRIERQLLASLGSFGLQDQRFVGLRQDAREAANSSLMQVRETARLATFFSSRGIPLIVLKGVALSAQFGQDPSLRNSRDIDLLVAPEQLLLADGVMQAAGYRTFDPIFTGPWSKELKYFHTTNGTLVELHTRLSNNAALLDYEFSDLWRRRETIQLAGVAVSVMPREQLALYLCAHGASHGWERLCWLKDLATVLKTSGSLETTVALATKEGLRGSMLQAIWLAHDCLGFPVSTELLYQSRSDYRVRWLNRLLRRWYRLSNWYQTPSRGSLVGFLRYSIWIRIYTYVLKPGWKYRRVQLVRELIAPADWNMFRLPRYLWWLYPIIRPIGWLVRRLIGAT